MSVKLVAMGNVLMKDDGIAIAVTQQIEKELIEKEITIIYGETDFEYCISRVQENDFVIVLDAALTGKMPGKVTARPLNKFPIQKRQYTQHSYHFLDLLKLYYPQADGVILTIEISEIAFEYGISTILQGKMKDITKDILANVDQILQVYLCF